MPKRILLLDDHHIVLDGLRRLIEARSHHQVVASCLDADAALETLARLPVDIVMTDLRMQGYSGVDVVKMLRLRHPDVALVVLTAEISASQIADAFRLGVKGVVLKEDAPSVLAECLDAVAQGAVYTAGRRQSHKKAGVAEHDDAPLLRLLTPREIEIANLITVGMRSKEIGTTLGISAGTVKIHLHNIYGKLSISTRVELANFMQAQR